MEKYLGHVCRELSLRDILTRTLIGQNLQGYHNRICGMHRITVCYGMYPEQATLNLVMSEENELIRNLVGRIPRTY